MNTFKDLINELSFEDFKYVFSYTNFFTTIETLYKYYMIDWSKYLIFRSEVFDFSLKTKERKTYAEEKINSIMFERCSLLIPSNHEELIYKHMLNGEFREMKINIHSYIPYEVGKLFIDQYAKLFSEKTVDIKKILNTAVVSDYSGNK